MMIIHSCFPQLVHTICLRSTALKLSDSDKFPHNLAVSPDQRSHILTKIYSLFSKSGGIRFSHNLLQTQRELSASDSINNCLLCSADLQTSGSYFLLQTNFHRLATVFASYLELSDSDNIHHSVLALDIPDSHIICSRPREFRISKFHRFFQKSLLSSSRIFRF